MTLMRSCRNFFFPLNQRIVTPQSRQSTTAGKRSFVLFFLFFPSLIVAEISHTRPSIHSKMIFSSLRAANLNKMLKFQMELSKGEKGPHLSHNPHTHTHTRTQNPPTKR
ncbi:hypothetical protein OUZ56_031975 [Daphnia magna]|uniref:Uncharacterized protein n=1 Tax=Daphnia magna TaxID=35525 RepID=A0ABQ9ZVT6_9CRUS|nr:hypothetical protein OUZ56_031975 [Daphnia magna]